MSSVKGSNLHPKELLFVSDSESGSGRKNAKRTQKNVKIKVSCFEFEESDVLTRKLGASLEVGKPSLKPKKNPRYILQIQKWNVLPTVRYLTFLILRKNLPPDQCIKKKPMR